MLGRNAWWEEAGVGEGSTAGNAKLDRQTPAQHRGQAGGAHAAEWSPGLFLT